MTREREEKHEKVKSRGRQAVHRLSQQRYSLAVMTREREEKHEKVKSRGRHCMGKLFIKEKYDIPYVSH